MPRHALPAQLHATWPPGPGVVRRGQWLGVVLLVSAVHAWLNGPLRQPLGHSPARAPAVQLVTLPPAESVAPRPQVQAELPTQLSPGQSVPGWLDVVNDGYAPPINPRAVELILRNNSTGASMVAVSSSRRFMSKSSLWRD